MKAFLFLLNLLGVILVFFVLVVIHEFGHFLLARFFGVKVLRFSIGFGRPIFTFRFLNSEFVIAWIPLGGYVRLLDEREGPVSQEEKIYAFNYKPIWQRTLIVVMGPLMNIIFAFSCFWFMFVTGEATVPSIVGEIVPNTPAAQSQLEVGDHIQKINGERANAWLLANLYIIEGIGKDTMELEVKKKDGLIQSVTLDLKNWKMNPTTMDIYKSLGFMPSKEKVIVYDQYSMSQSFKQAYERLNIYLSFNFKVLYKLCIGEISIQSLLGPIGFMTVTFFVLREGLSVLFNFLGIVSMSIAFMNLLPIPMLDGGHLLYLVIEKITGRPVSVPMQVLLYKMAIIGFSLFLFQLIMNDITRWVA